jgi:hypothetical protein
MTPSGDRKSVKVTFPWESSPLLFPARSQYSISARVLGHNKALAMIQCTLTRTPQGLRTGIDARNGIRSCELTGKV